LSVQTARKNHRRLKEMPLKEFNCGDGTTMRSASDEELIRAIQYHMDKFHSQKPSDDEARTYLKNVAD